MVVTTFFRTGKPLSLTMIARHETDRIIAAPREARTKTQAAPNGSGTNDGNLLWDFCRSHESSQIFSTVKKQTQVVSVQAVLAIIRVALSR
jgi:hypothetical protein